MRPIEGKIVSRSEAVALREELRRRGLRVVFSNGCFDILHAGHAATLAFARQQGDVLFVGMNSDSSLRTYKGEKRPLIGQEHRAFLLAALESVDHVVIFDEPEVDALVRELRPDVLVKGSDRAGEVVGQEFVESYGGVVVTAPIVQGLSTTALIRRVLRAYGDAPARG